MSRHPSTALSQKATKLDFQIKKHCHSNGFIKNKKRDLITSGFKLVDEALAGGLKLGNVVEFGIPEGQSGRRFVLQFLIHKKPKTLWIYNSSNSRIYPPSWESLGVDLNQTFFVSSPSCLADLKQVFTSRFFDLIIIDQKKNPSRDEWTFFSLQARRMNKLIIVIKPSRLRISSGNPFAKTRANVWFDFSDQHYQMEPIKGIFRGPLTFSIKKLPTPVPVIDRSV